MPQADTFNNDGFWDQFGDIWMTLFRGVSEVWSGDRGAITAGDLKQSIFQGTRLALSQGKSKDDIIAMYQNMEMRHGNSLGVSPEN